MIPFFQGPPPSNLGFVAKPEMPPHINILFRARPPLEYVPPTEKKTKTRYAFVHDGNLDLDKIFEDGPPPERVCRETPAQRKERIWKERVIEHYYKTKEERGKYDPTKDKHVTSDPYKTLFVSRLNFNTDEETLRKEMERFGPVTNLRLVRDKKTGKSRGYAFVEFERTKHCHRLYDASGMKIDGKKILVDYELARTNKDWIPKRLGGGKGNKRRDRDAEKEIRRVIKEHKKSQRGDSRRSESKRSESKRNESKKKESSRDDRPEDHSHKRQKVDEDKEVRRESRRDETKREEPKFEKQSSHETSTRNERKHEEMKVDSQPKPVEIKEPILQPPPKMTESKPDLPPPPKFDPPKEPSPISAPSNPIIPPPPSTEPQAPSKPTPIASLELDQAPKENPKETPLADPKNKENGENRERERKNSDRNRETSERHRDNSDRHRDRSRDKSLKNKDSKHKDRHRSRSRDKKDKKDRKDKKDKKEKKDKKSKKHHKDHKDSKDHKDKKKHRKHGSRGRDSVESGEFKGDDRH